jgi:hypothetical protein
MHAIDLNMARSHIGRKVNLHLRDGSVIINVLVTSAGRSLYGFEPGRTVLHFVASLRGKVNKISLKDVEWLEPLDTTFCS